MVEYKRAQYSEVMARINEPRSKMQVIVGPRQVGKSTLISQVLEACELPYDSYSADDVVGASADWLAGIWQTARMRMDMRGEGKRLLVVDEIQKITNWSETVKAEWDRDTRELVVVLLGLSRMLIEKDLTESLAGYLHLLDECGLLCGLQKYAEDDVRKYNSIPKFQVHNNALRNVYADKDYMEMAEDPKAWGRYVESAVGAYIVSQAQICDYKAYYWRDSHDEVDYILHRRGKTIAIEVKSGRRTTNNGLPKFEKAYHPHRAFVVGAGGLSFEEFLSMDLNLLFK